MPYVVFNRELHIGGQVYPAGTIGKVRTTDNYEKVNAISTDMGNKLTVPYADTTACDTLKDAIKQASKYPAIGV